MSQANKSVTQLEEPDHIEQQRWEWRIERMAWVIMAGLLFAALLGLFGPGPLSWSETATADKSLVIEYSTLEHYEAPSELRVRLFPKKQEEGKVRLRLTRNFADERTIESITPQPESVEARQDDLLVTFRMRDIDDGGLITCRYTHDTFGPTETEIGLVDHGSLRFSQFVFP